MQEWNWKAFPKNFIYGLCFKVLFINYLCWYSWFYSLLEKVGFFPSWNLLKEKNAMCNKNINKLTFFVCIMQSIKFNYHTWHQENQWAKSVTFKRFYTYLNQTVNLWKLHVAVFDHKSLKPRLFGCFHIHLLLWNSFLPNPDEKCLRSKQTRFKCFVVKENYVCLQLCFPKKFQHSTWQAKEKWVHIFLQHRGSMQFPQTTCDV